jgi:hypothetical protein
MGIQFAEPIETEDLPCSCCTCFRIPRIASWDSKNEILVKRLMIELKVGVCDHPEHRSETDCVDGDAVFGCCVLTDTRV